MIRTVGIISRPRRTDIARVVPPLLEWLRAHDVQILCDLETSGCIDRLSGKTEKREDLPKRSDLLIVLGGDGTLLSAAREAAQYQVPILAVNLGSMGFLTTVPEEELYAILEEIFSGQLRVSERVMLSAEVIRDGAVMRRQIALNDAVFNKGALARIIDLELRVDGDFVTSYKADGLILSTPTGSTAYSLAAGGPIVYPTVEAFVVTPICPHTLTNRPLVVPDTVKIEVHFPTVQESVFLTLDGQVGIEIKQGDHVMVRKAEEKLRLVRRTKKAYYQILRSKLKWGER